jgi:hypothetical protein
MGSLYCQPKVFESARDDPLFQYYEIARSRRTDRDMQRYQELLEKHANKTLMPAECAELTHPAP